MKTLLATLSGASLTLLAGAAAAGPPRIGIAGPTGARIVERLQRNVASMKVEAVSASVTICTRDVVQRLFRELDVEALLCTDGDQIGVWARTGEHVALKEAVVVQSADERSEEIAAARATMALEPPSEGNTAPDGLTIVANAGVVPSTLEGEPHRDTPAEPARAPVVARERITPHWVFGLGPSVVSSRDGSSFAVSGEVQIGVNRYVAVTPWISFVPANRIVESSVGRAEFRPTTFGLGFTIPIFAPSSFIVPRIGAGYAMVWLHVAPRAAFGSAQQRDPEDLLAPAIYSNLGLSFKVTPQLRAVVDGMAGMTSHDMVVRMGFNDASHWGVPFVSGSLRAEWVLP